MKATALDARSLGFETYLIADACRGVNFQAGDVDRALAEMQAAGVEVVMSGRFLAEKVERGAAEGVRR